MYKKDLSESIRIRVSFADLEFLISLSEAMHCSVSAVVRSLILQSRLRAAMEVSEDGHTKTDSNNIV